MNDLEVKTVEFMGDELLATQDSEGIIWAGVRGMCNGIGLSEDRMKYERKRIHEDVVLSKGERNFVLPTRFGNKETLCLQLDYVPLWLAKISITPKMKEEKPELVEKLVAYQLKAKDVLAAAFLPQYKEADQNNSSQSSASDFVPIMEAVLAHEREQFGMMENLLVQNMDLLKHAIDALERKSSASYNNEATESTPTKKRGVKTVDVPIEQGTDKAVKEKPVKIKPDKEKPSARAAMQEFRANSITLEGVSYAEWRENVNKLAKKVVAHDPKYKDVVQIYNELFTKLWSVYGYVQVEETKKFRERYQISRQGNVDRLQVLFESAEPWRDIFNSLLTDMVCNTCGEMNDLVVTREAIWNTIKPLAEKIGDNHPYCVKSFHEVYQRMEDEGHSWVTYRKKYKKRFGKKATNKIDFLEVFPELFYKFRKITRDLISEMDKQESTPCQS